MNVDANSGEATTWEKSVYKFGHIGRTGDAMTATAKALVVIVMCLGTALALAVPTLAQAWPQRNITILVPFPPGPAVDLVARLLGGKLSAALGQSVVVENRTGANGTIASVAVARAAPDGYTLLMGTAGTHVTAVHLMKSLPYDPVKDFTPIIAAVEPVTCLAINAKLPVASVEELIAYAKVRPGEMSYGSSGIGSVFHLMGALFNSTAGVQINHVAYRGVEPAMQDTIGGHVPMVFIAASNAMAGHEAGQVKILAILEPQRYSKLPDIRSMSEILPEFRKPSSWFGVFAPPGLPTDIQLRLNVEMDKALKDPEVKSRLEGLGLAVIGGSANQFAELIRDGIDRYGTIIREAGIQPN